MTKPDINLNSLTQLYSGVLADPFIPLAPYLIYLYITTHSSEEKVIHTTDYRKTNRKTERYQAKRKKSIEQIVEKQTKTKGCTEES